MVLTASPVSCWMRVRDGSGSSGPVSRSEERRGGEEGRSRGGAYHLKKKKMRNLAGWRGDADHHPEEEVTAEQEVNGHQQMRGVVAYRDVENADDVKVVKTRDEQHRGRD